jgi:dUTP pyrophosphatase
MKVEVIKFDNYKTPNRAHYNDSGADCFAAKDMIIPAGKVIKVPTGVGVRLPDGYDIVVHCKSGLSSKGIWAANAPVDAGYTGEIHAILYNTSDQDYKIEAGDKIGQFVIRPVIYAEFVDSLDKEGRGANGFGSTGK